MLVWIHLAIFLKMFELLIEATWQTVLMVLISTIIGIIGGLPIAIALFATARLGLFENLLINRTVGLTVNAIRSIPYIILVVALIPFTRIITGSSIGTIAASVPLSIAAIMFFCRIAEESLRTVPNGLLEAALSMGATRFQVITKVVLPESLPSMISGLTLVMISLVGFSAMAGAVGGGGLGDLGIRYGYQRYDFVVMMEVIVILVLMVQGIQSTGDWAAKKLRK